MKTPWFGLLCVATGCTTLGPMPTTMGIPAMPAARPEVSVTTHALPGYYLSSTVVADGKGTAMLGSSVLIEPDRLLEFPGLIVGARAYGDKNDIGFEPMLGYRRKISPASPVAYGAVIAFTRASGKARGAEYEATRVSAEAMAEYRFFQSARTVDVSLTTAVNATALSAEAAYCVDAKGYGHDCGDTEMTIAGKASGVYVAGTAGVAVDVGRRWHNTFHGLRFALTGTGGTMPTLVNGMQQSARGFFALGINLGVNFGSEK